MMQGYSKRGTGPQALENIHPVLHPLRQVKSEAEIDLLRKATAISAEAHNRAREFAKVGHY